MPIARILPVAAVIAVSIAVSAVSALAPIPDSWPDAVEDNSFLIEEAYNQEAGVVQYILNAWFLRPGNAWALAFTNEWPVPGQTHQLSYTVPYVLSDDEGSGVGDLYLNYRYQLATQETSYAAVAPRATLVCPTGDWQRGFGQGAYGLQANLPVSRRLSRTWAGHLNLGATWLNGARTELPDGSVAEDDQVNLFGGASAIWLASPTFNLMLELFAYRDEERVDASTVERRTRAVLSPGFRRAINTRSGQLVLGATIPIGLSEASPDPGVFLYFSWEAPHWRP
jgi:hypothetical protein